MKRVRLIVAFVILVVLWNTCSTSNKSVGFARPYVYENDRFIPAGDSSVEEPRIVKSTKPWGAEYARRSRVWHLPIEERWSVDSPHIATVTRGGVIHSYTPGWVNATLKLRGFTKVLNFRVGPPMDSVVMRFSTREAMVGDTVDLFLRRYYADGSEEVGHRWEPFPDDRDHNGIQRGERIYPARNQEHAVDTIRFWIRRPGTFRIQSETHGRAPILDSIRIVRDLGRTPRLIRAPEWGRPQQPVPNRRPATCYALAFGAWTDGRFVVTQEHYAWLPATVELDSTLVVPRRPDLGMRVNPVGSNRFEMARSWQREGDSLVIRFETRENRIPHQRPRIAFPFTGDEVRGLAVDGSTEAEVTARRVGCN